MVADQNQEIYEVLATNINEKTGQKTIFMAEQDQDTNDKKNCDICEACDFPHQ